MGLFDSDYEAVGSVSAIQIGEQRDHKDSYLAELLIQQSKNGRSMADEMRYDIFHGVTYTFRKYGRVGAKNDFIGKIGTKAGSSNDIHFDLVKGVMPNATATAGSWRLTSGRELALYYMSSGAYQYRETTSGAASIVDMGIRRNILSQGVGGSGFIELTLDNGAVVVTPYREDAAPQEGYYAKVRSKVNLDDPYFSYYFSTNQEHKIEIAADKNLDTLPVVSLKDNDNNEEPYHLLDPSDPEFQRREKTLDVVGINFKEMGEEIFEPAEIPADGSDEWNNNHGKAYRNSEELQSQYPSETSYQANLVEDRLNMKENIKNITDVHFGMFISPKTLDWSNVFAMRAVLHDILPGLEPYDKKMAIGSQTFDSTMVMVECGSLKIRYEFGGYEVGRVIGSLDSYNPDFDGVAVDMKDTPRKKARYGILTDYNSEDNASPDSTDINTVTEEDSYHNMDFNNLGNKPSGAVVIAVKDGTTALGQPIYSYIKIWDLFAEHVIDTKHHATSGEAQSVSVKGSLMGMDDDEYSDIFILPLTANAVKSVSIFKRERLMRECSMIVIDGIQVSEVKWYQKGVFQVIFMVLAIVISCYISACTTAAFAAGGVSAAAEAFIAYAVSALFAGVALDLILSAIDNPLIAALVIILSAVVFGKLNTSSLTEMATLAVEATGTFLQKKTALDMIELQEKMKEEKAKLNEAQEELDDFMEANGIFFGVDTDYILSMMQSPPPGEMAKDFYERTLNRDLCIISQDEEITARKRIKLPNRNV